MTPQQIIAIAIRLFAIWIGIMTIPYFTTIPYAMSQQTGQAMWGSYVVAVVYLLIAVVLWFFPMSIAHRLIPKTQFENKIEASALEVARVGCCLFGLWLLIHSGPGLVFYILRISMVADGITMDKSLPTGMKLDIAFYLSQLVIALILVFKSGTIANLLMRSSK